MNKYLIFGVFVLVLSLTLVVAMKSDRVLATVDQSKNGVQVIIPEHAVEVSPDIFSLGTTVDSKGRVLEGFAIVDRVDNRKGQAKPGTVCGNDICEPGEKKSCAADCGGGGDTGGDSTCYSTYAKGAKWKVAEDYIVDASNSAGLNESFVSSNFAGTLTEWEDAAGVNIFGNEVAGVVNVDSIGNSVNDQNEMVFADISSPGAIAVTYAWGIFSGPPGQREIVEWDKVYDDVDYDWSQNCLADNCTSKMDFENIAQHESGHALGLGHPSDTCTEETMFRFASFNEVKKRDLAAGDISGVVKVYG